ncbi:MAG: methylated-DNA-protein-cysteine methyltransferase-like protein [Maribacter sp.]|jgi:methylated-DNA-protein-cysteine methyltransferase-like protein
MHDKSKKDKKSFLEDVFEVAREIPYGRVSTYGAVANTVGTVTARMVGWAMNKSYTTDPPVPAHRVVNRKGELTGRHHFPTPTMMQELLENEGVIVKQNKVQDFKSLNWNPIEELTD